MNELTNQMHAQTGKRGEVFKTEHLTDQQHEQVKGNANKQEARILRHLTESVFVPVGASEIYNCVALVGEPLTSYRRALNSLAKQGKVEKMAEKRVGYYGSNEHLWRLKRDEP